MHKNIKFALKVHYTLLMNKMVVGFAFRPLTIVLYTLSCINNIELKRKINKRNTLIYLTTISVPPIYIIYVYEKILASKTIARC